MLLQKFDTILNEYYCLPMDKSISKKQRLYLKRLQKHTSEKFHPTLKKQILKKDSTWFVNHKGSKVKRKTKGVARISSFQKRRLRQECLARNATVILNKIEDCPDINAVWIYDRSIGKYRWVTYSNVTSHEDVCEKETQDISEELSFIITEVRGNASDVFESVCFSSDAETEETENYSEENLESETDLGGIVEIHENYEPTHQGQHITIEVDENETVEGPLNYEIKPNKKTDSGDVCEDEKSNRDTCCTESLEISSIPTDSTWKERIMNGQSLSLTRKVSGNAKSKRRKKCLKKTIKINKKSSPVYFRREGVKPNSEKRLRFTFIKEKRLSRIGKHSKRFRDIMKNAPRYWRSRSTLISKKILSNKCNEEKRKPAVPMRVPLLETYQKLPESDNESKNLFHIVNQNSENVTPHQNLELSEKTLKLRIRRKTSKLSKIINEDCSSSQENSTDGASTKRKTNKQETTTNSGSSDDGYSLLDQELPGYNWLEKKIKSGEIKTTRRNSNTSQDTISAVLETTHPEDQTGCNLKPDNEGVATIQPQNAIHKNIDQDEITESSNIQKQQNEIPDKNVFSSETKEPLEVTSPESGVEIDVAPLSAGDSEGDFLAQGIYLVINENDINSENNRYVDNSTRDVTEKKNCTTEQEEYSEKIQTVTTKAVSNESETNQEQDHICNNEACLLSVPERIRMENRKSSVNSLEDSTPSVSWVDPAVAAEKKSQGQSNENRIINTYSPINSPPSVDSLQTKQTQEAGANSKAIELELECTSNVEMPTDKTSSPVSQNSISASDTNKNDNVTLEIQQEVSLLKQINNTNHNVTPVNIVKDHIFNEQKVTKTSHIPVQQLSTNPVIIAAPRRVDTFQNSLRSSPNIRGKSERFRQIAPAPSVDKSKHLMTYQSNIMQNQMSSSGNKVNQSYGSNSPDCRTEYLRSSYEHYLPPTTWPRLYPAQGLYQPNFNSGEPTCQIKEHYMLNSTPQSEKNFTISSLLELQSNSAQSHSGIQANTNTESSKLTDSRRTTIIGKNQPSANSTDIAPPSTLRSRLEGNIPKKTLLEPPKLNIDEDSTDDIKIVYNKLTSLRNQPASVPVNNQSNMTSKESMNCLPSASQTQTQPISFQDHQVQNATNEKPEQQSVPTASAPLPILPKPMPIQAPVRPSPVLMAPMIENVDQQKIYQTSTADCLQPIKRTPPQAESVPSGYQQISSYHAPPKSLREEVEYRKRELMYLDQLARKREKEFERLQNIRKSKIRLLKLLENRIPIALNKGTQKTVPYYYCPQTEKSMESEGWTNQTSTQVVLSEKSDNSTTPTSPQIGGTSQVSSICNNYNHYPPPNDRIKYELNNFISSFNSQMHEMKKDKDSITVSRKEHDVSFNVESAQNISATSSLSAPAFGIQKHSSAPTANVARIVPVTKNKMVEVSSTTIIPATSYIEKGSSCQINYTVRSIQQPYPDITEMNKYQTLPSSQKDYSTCQYQNVNNYDPQYSDSSHKMLVPPLRSYEQPVASSQASIPNQQQEQMLKEGMLTENAQHQYYGNKIWPDQSNWPKHSIQKIAPSNTSPYQPEPRQPSPFWHMTNPPVDVLSGSQRLKFPPDVQPRIDDSAIGLVFVDASKSSHVCSYCNGNAIFLCSSCKKAWYCGRECQRRSWAQHSAVCVSD